MSLRRFLTSSAPRFVTKTLLHRRGLPSVTACAARRAPSEYRSRIVRPGLFAGLLLLSVCFDAAAGDLYAAINRLRANEGNCVAAPGLQPLRPHAALERIARNLSQGVSRQRSLRDAGYDAARFGALSITGSAVGAVPAGTLVEQNYCKELQDAAMTEVGVYRDTRQIWIVMAAPTAPQAGYSGNVPGMRILELVNQARARPRNCGNSRLDAARPVRWNDSLAEASRLHAEEMARYGYFSHHGRDGSEPWERIVRTGYRYGSMGENIAAGQRNPEEAVAAWIGSPSHCANLMNPIFTEMGAAVAINTRSSFGRYWTQAFGTPR
jgi:uncharacterized protein YkwD